VPLVLQHLLDRGQHLGHRPAGEHHGPPCDAQAHAERGLLRAAAAHVTDHHVHPAVGRLDQVEEVPAEQHLAAAGPVPGRDRQPRVRQQRRRQQAAFQPGVLPRDELCLAQLLLDLLGPAALHRVPDDPAQQLPVHLALDQVVLRTGANRLGAEVLVGQAGEHDHGDLGHVLPQPVHPLQLVRVGQVKVEQHAGRRGQQRFGLGDRPHPVEGHRGTRVQQVLLDEQGIPVVVLDEQHPHVARDGRGSRDPGLRGVPGHRLAPFMAFVGVPSLTGKVCG
jgi:hypothetical protein